MISELIIDFSFKWEIFFAIASILLVYLFLTWLRNPLRQIPGPKGSLFLGNSRDLSKPNDGHKVLIEWGRKYGDVYKTWDILGGYRIHLQNPEHLKSMLITNSTKFSKPNFVGKLIDFKISGKTLFNVSGKEHALHRKLLNPYFSYGTVQAYIPIFNKIADSLIKVWKENINDEQGEYEDRIQEKFTCLTLDVIGESAFSYRFNSVTGGHTKESKATDIILRGQFNLGRRALEYYFPFLKLFPSEERQRVEEAKEIAADTVYKVIKKRREKLADTTAETEKDLLQALITTQENGISIFKDNDVLSQVMSFMIAGHETTSMTMTWTILLLAKHQEYQERARQEIRRVLGSKDDVTLHDVKEMTFLENCIKESMRLYPAIITANRETMIDMQIGPYMIPKNTKIKVDIASIHRNEKYWKEANRFNPDRYDGETDKASQGTELQFRFIPFLRGPRMCIGYRFAEVEIKVVLAKLLRVFHFQLGKEQPREFEAELTLSLRPSPSPIVQISIAP